MFCEENFDGDLLIFIVQCIHNPFWEFVLSFQRQLSHIPIMSKGSGRGLRVELRKHNIVRLIIYLRLPCLAIDFSCLSICGSLQEWFIAGIITDSLLAHTGSVFRLHKLFERAPVGENSSGYLCIFQGRVSNWLCQLWFGWLRLYCNTLNSHCQFFSS